MVAFVRFGVTDTRLREVWINPEAVDSVTALDGGCRIRMRSGDAHYGEESAEEVVQRLVPTRPGAFCGHSLGEGVVCVKPPVNWGRCYEHQPQDT